MSEVVPAETPILTVSRLVEASLDQLRSPSLTDADRQSVIGRLELANRLLNGLDPYLDSVSSGGPPSLQPLIHETIHHDWARAYQEKKVSFKVNPSWSAGAYEGSFVALVARAVGAKRVLEIGMFTGTTTLCVASSLPSDGKVVCLEIDQYFEDLARPYFEKAGVSSKIDVKVGKALDFLQSYDGEPFDLIFIDADKTGYLGYFNAIFDRGLLSKSGVLLVDNVLYKGLPITDGLQSESTAERVDNGGALKHFNQVVRQDKRVEVCVLPIRDGVSFIMHK